MLKSNNQFYELTETAILGTDRKPLTRLVASGGLGQTIGEIAEIEIQGQPMAPERVLLDQLTVLSIARKAGLTPQVINQVISVCPEEKYERVSERSLALLIQILALETKGSELRPSKMIADWLSYCHEAKQRVPEEFVPRLLLLGKNIPEIHKPIENCCGEHFHWLVSLNSDWQVYRPSADSEMDLTNAFETGESKERLKALQLLRKANPVAALNLLKGSFEKETVDSKLSFLKALTDLSLNDEPFLEEVALIDRRKEVRAQAAFALSTIAGSRLQQRMIERANLSLTFTNVLNIALPEKLDEDMLRDGVSENLSIDSRMGQKANWLCQIIGMVPTSHWQKRFRLSAEQLLQAATTNAEWSLLLTLAFISSAAKFGEADMQEAILKCSSIHLTDSQYGLQLLKSLPHAMLENLILQKLPSWSRQTEQAPRLDLWYYLEQVDFNWSEHFTREILKFIIKECREKVPVFGHTFYSNASIFALRMHISAGELIEQIAINAEMTDIYRRNALERMSDTVKLRYEIYQSFNKGNN